MREAKNTEKLINWIENSWFISIILFIGSILLAISGTFKFYRKIKDFFERKL